MASTPSGGGLLANVQRQLAQGRSDEEILAGLTAGGLSLTSATRFARPRAPRGRRSRKRPSRVCRPAAPSDCPAGAVPGAAAARPQRCAIHGRSASAGCCRARWLLRPLPGPRRSGPEISWVVVVGGAVIVVRGTFAANAIASLREPGPRRLRSSRRSSGLQRGRRAVRPPSRGTSTRWREEERTTSASRASELARPRPASTAAAIEDALSTAKSDDERGASPTSSCGSAKPTRMLAQYRQRSQGDSDALRRHAVVGFGDVGAPAALQALPVLKHVLASTPTAERRCLVVLTLTQAGPGPGRCCGRWRQTRIRVRTVASALDPRRESLVGPRRLRPLAERGELRIAEDRWRNLARPAMAAGPMPLDRDAREREYSPSSVIGGDYAPFLERYRTESAAALRTLAVQRDLSYGDASRALIDYFPAPASAHRPGLLVYFHGGYWQELSKDGVGVPRAGLACGGVRARGRRLQAGARGTSSRHRQRVPRGRAVAALACRQARLRRRPTSSPPAARRARTWRPRARTRRPAPLRGIVPVSGIYDVAPLIGTSINDALGLDDATAAAMDLLTTRAPVLPRRRRVGRDRDVGVQAPEPGVRGAARGRRDPVHVARSSRPQPLRRGARSGRSGVAAVRRRARAVRNSEPQTPNSEALPRGLESVVRQFLRHRGADAEALVAPLAGLEHLRQAIDGVPDVDEAGVERREAEAQDVRRAEIADHAAGDQRLHDRRRRRPRAPRSPGCRAARARAASRSSGRAPRSAARRAR